MTGTGLDESLQKGVLSHGYKKDRSMARAPREDSKLLLNNYYDKEEPQAGGGGGTLWQEVKHGKHMQ